MTTAKIVSLVEIAIFLLVIVILSFLNISTSNYLIPISLLFVVFRIAWLYRSKQLTMVNDFLKNKLFTGWPWYLLVFVLGVCTLFLIRNNVESFPMWLVDSEPIWFSFFHTGVQELIFRVYLLNRLRFILCSPIIIAIIGGIFFGMVHFILPNAMYVVISTSILGIAWSYIYQKYPNFIIIWFSHALLNILIKYLF